MSEKKVPIPVRTSLTPTYYKEFHCLADKCRDSCCLGWSVTFSKKDYLRLRRLDAPEAFKERLDNTVKRMRNTNKTGSANYAEFRLDKNGCCPLLDDDSLCSLQKTCGEEALPFVCTSFPRIQRYTPAAKESCMTLGCEGVLKLLWDMTGGVEFIEEELDKQQTKNVLMNESSPARWFEPIRSLCIDILQNRDITLPQRMLLLGVALQKLSEVECTAPEVEKWLQKYALFAKGDAAREGLDTLKSDQFMFLTQNISVAYKLRVNLWARTLLEGAGASISIQDSSLNCTVGTEKYQARKQALQDAFGDIGYFFENIMVAAVLHLNFPNLNNTEELWKSYVNLCNLYSFFRFAAVTGCGDPPSKDELIHVLVMASRSLMHNSTRQAQLRDDFFRHDSATLAHMAILVGE